MTEEAVLAGTHYGKLCRFAACVRMHSIGAHNTKYRRVVRITIHMQIFSGILMPTRKLAIANRTCVSGKN